MKRYHAGLMLVLSSLILARSAVADSIVLGFNTVTPVQVYSTSGTNEQDFGPNGASAGIEENGLMYIVQPNASTGTSTISALYSDQTVASSFTVADLIADGAPGQGGTLWLSGYDGQVYRVSTSNGAVLSSFNTGFSSATVVGIASNGSTLYTTEGDSSDGIDVRDSSGTVLSTISTGLTSLYGLGFSSTDSTLYAGSTDFVYQLSLSGSVLNNYDITGDFRTPNGAVHDGLEIADLSLLSAPPVTTTVPEPRTASLVAFIFGSMLLLRLLRKWPKAGLVLAMLGIPAFGAVSVTLSQSASTVPVGTAVTFTAQATDTTNGAATFTYQFSVRSGSSGPFAIVKDFWKTNTVTWAPTQHEGSYEVQVVARSSAGGTGSNSDLLGVTSLVQGSTPVVTPTNNPLVVLYSAPPCNSPSKVRVRFKSAAATAWQATPFQTCDGLSLNFYIAGMYANTTYTLQQDTYNGPFDTPGPPLSHRTGSIPGSVSFPARTLVTGPAAPTSTSFPFVLQTVTFFPFATDLAGNVVWYLDAGNSPANGPNSDGTWLRNTNGGNLLGAQDDPSDTCPTTGQYCKDQQFLREFDLAGNIVRETNWTLIGQQLNVLRAAEGRPPTHICNINHEAYRLPNGDTAIQLMDEEIANQGQGNVDVLGDVIGVLDSNFQLVWYWDTFDHLDITRKALLNDVCATGGPGCPILRLKQPNGQYYTTANDWTHVNSITYDPKDGNLVVSSRHQSWIWKIAYQNGSAAINGPIIWTLGMQGDFALPSGYGSDAWFSYQHNAQFQANGVLTLFDNGNYRIHQAGGGNSRGQGWQLDEVHMIATPVANFDLGVFSAAVGYASILSNGNYDYSAGFINGGTQTQTTEFTPGGTAVYKQGVNAFTYRVFRLPDLYTER